MEFADWDTFSKHHADYVIVRWPAQPPTMGIEAHVGNNPYKIFAQGDWTCSAAEFTGTYKGPMLDVDGKTFRATNRSLKVNFCTVARWKDGKIVEENLFYDLVGMMRQLGLM